MNLGDDADTTGAVCGQLAGAYWGETGIPRVAGRIGSQGHDRTTIEKAAEGIGMSKKRAAMVAKKEVDNPKPQAAALYTLEVFIIGGPVSEKFLKRNPQISRTIQIRGDQTLEDLNHVIFDAFDRWEEHLFEFQIGKGPNDPKGKRYVLPHAFDSRRAKCSGRCSQDHHRLPGPEGRIRRSATGSTSATTGGIRSMCWPLTISCRRASVLR